MSMKIAPAGTSPHDTGKWITVGTTDRATFDFKTDTETLDFFGGRQAMRTSGQTRSVIIDFADGRRTYIPHADIRIETPDPKGNLIVDGSITAKSISSGSITQQRLWAQPDSDCHFTFPSSLEKRARSLAILNEVATTFGAMPHRFATGGVYAPPTTEEFPLTEQKFTNAIDVSITVDNNGVYPMIKTSRGQNQYAVLRDADVPAFLKAVIDNSGKYRGLRAVSVVQDGKPSIKVGDGGAAGIVYKPTTEDQAKRNLNFAIANLAAYTEWETTGRKEAEEAEEKRQAALKALREQAKRIEEKEAERRAKVAAEERKRRDALTFYNKANGTSHYTWASIPFIGSTIIQHWIDLSEASKRATSPFGQRIQIGAPAFDGGSRFPVRSWL